MVLVANPAATAAVALAGFAVNSLAILVINLASSLTLKVRGPGIDVWACGCEWGGKKGEDSLPLLCVPLPSC
eukprot:366572-Chlamydomonas_euryale.AAC.12